MSRLTVNIVDLFHLKSVSERSLNVTVTDVCTDLHLQRSAYVMCRTLKVEAFPAGLPCCAGEHPPCLRRALWVPYAAEQALLALPTGVGLQKGRRRTGVLMHIKSSLPLLTCFEVGSIFFRP